MTDAVDSTKQGAGRPRFVVDHMVLKLGKYLRILGYDTVWNKTVRTHELIDMANREKRIFLTRNRRLPDQYPPARHVVFLDSADPVQQLRELVALLHLDTEKSLFSTCIRCNVPLDRVPDKTDVRASVHPNVYAQYERFYRCPRCGTVFWKGSHVRNTCRKLGISCPARNGE